ncbi:Asp23/Gls24 family envelope stress response protein [Amycolatopsis plumensis]|uniref:Asp23/Gls24 family envelope stress response protein n=1 Tax=Amycolatopsis plumensis TaxID=236508 RepID=A0ABV5U174_9PSEU
MSDVINSIFGRPQNETAGSGGYSYGTAEPEPATEAAAVVEETDSAPEADTATETAEDTAEAGEEAVAEDAEEDDTDETEDAAEAADDEPVAEAVDTEPVAEVADEEPTAETAPVAETAETEPVAEAVEAEPVAEPVAVTEPEADAPATRPAPGSRGSTTVADGVVGKIVTRIAAQTEGVHSVAGDGITVELADEVAWVTIPVVVEFGHAVKALGEQIRVAVIDAVEQYLGLDVEVVDVHVADIHFPEAD